MKPRVLLALSILWIVFQVLAPAATAKRKGGFQGATPKPTPDAEPETSAAATPKSGSTGASSKSRAKSKTQGGAKASASPTPGKRKATPAPASPTPSPAVADPDPDPERVSKGQSTPKPAKTAKGKTAPASKPKATPTPDPDAGAPASRPAAEALGVNGMMGPDVASLSAESLAEWNQQPDWLQKLIRAALELSARNLGYLYGSADPARGGMDCSGTIFYLLNQQGYRNVPRDSSGQYGWLQTAGTLRQLPAEDGARFDARALRPGDLLFWTGTYDVQREIPISHVMLFLGTEKATGKPVMWGASDGRTYGGRQRYGVSVFDFRLPKADSKSKFVGFGQLDRP